MKSFLLRSTWSFVDRLFLTLCVFGVASLFIWHYAPKLEGWINPVINNVQLHTSAEFPPPDYRTIWNATGTKVRGNCTFEGISWWMGNRNGSRVRVFAEFQDKPKIRGSGELEWERLVIWLDEQNVRRNSFGTVYHSCPGRPWLVETPFYDSPHERTLENVR